MQANQPKGYNTVFSDMNTADANHQPPSLDLNATMKVNDPLTQTGKTFVDMGTMYVSQMHFKNSSENPGDFKNPLGRDDSSFDINLETMPRANLQVTKIHEEKIMKSSKTMIY